MVKVMATAAMLAMALLSLMAVKSMGEDMMFAGESINSNEYLENGPYRFIMQGDCNLVLYINQNRALWNSATNGRGTNCRATLRDDGNLVILSGSIVIWTSNTARGNNNYRLIVQGDGNVVIYGAALWATNTAGKNLVGK